VWEIFQGVTLHRCPGHTEGLCIAEFLLPSGKTFIATSDLLHVKENYEQGIPQGSLITELNQWHRSRQYVQQLVKRRDAMVLLGHDIDYFESFEKSPKYIS
jgi:glyoxylase-like metal-dependent hydrolase (beta-lactamase superfamily II)